MCSQSMLQDIMRFEMEMGPSHECHDCGSTFLANSDRCSNCGSYRISSLHKEEEGKWDMETFPITIYSMEENGIQIENVDSGDFSSYPRAEV